MFDVVVLQARDVVVAIGDDALSSYEARAAAPPLSWIPL